MPLADYSQDAGWIRERFFWRRARASIRAEKQSQQSDLLQFL